VKSQLKEIKKIMKARKSSKENELLTQNSKAFDDNILKRKEKEYLVFIGKGDVAIKDRYLGKAKAYYKKALGVFERDYPREKLREIEDLRFAFKSEKERESYERFMSLGEKEFEKSNYSVSRHYYKKALVLAADRSIVKDKLNEIEKSIIEDKQKTLDLEYDDLAKKGNSAFKSGNLSVAKFYFIKALKIKPKDTQMKENLESIKNSLK
jgi:tetratricopeptide (TPR) repeat protein